MRYVVRLAGRSCGRWSGIGRVLMDVPDADRVHVFQHHLLQVVADRNLTRLAALLLKMQYPLFAGMIETGPPKRAHGGGAAGRGVIKIATMARSRSPTIGE